MRRGAALAGSWYPADPRRCEAAIARHAAGAVPEPGPWRGAIAPHAGWTYSGDAAAGAYRWLAEAHDQGVDLVVLFGSHRGPHGPHTVFRGSAWETPCGDLENASPLADRVAAALPVEDEPVHPRRADNGAELQLPFLKHFWPRAELLMLGVGASAEAIAIGRTVGELVRESGRNALFVGSTDLTHYGPQYGWGAVGVGAAAERWVRDTNDQGFLDRVLADDTAGAIRHATQNRSACCPGAVAAALEAARAWQGHVTPRLVAHYLSSDVRPSDSCVGYAGLVF